jgi:hypothetical protein
VLMASAVRNTQRRRHSVNSATIGVERKSRSRTHEFDSLNYR